jgi:hypothetical protein
MKRREARENPRENRAIFEHVLLRSPARNVLFRREIGAVTDTREADE